MSPDYLSPSPDKLRKELTAAFDEDSRQRKTLYRKKDEEKEEFAQIRPRRSFDREGDEEKEFEPKKKRKAYRSPDREDEEEGYNSPTHLNKEEYKKKKMLKKKWNKGYDEKSAEPWTTWKSSKGSFDSDRELQDKFAEVSDAIKREDDRDFDAREIKYKSRSFEKTRPSRDSLTRAIKNSPDHLDIKEVLDKVEDTDGKTTFYHYTTDYKSSKDRSTGRSKSPKPTSKTTVKAERKRKLSAGSAERKGDLPDYSDLENNVTEVQDTEDNVKDKVIKKKKKQKPKKPITPEKRNLLKKVTEILRSCDEPLKDTAPANKEEVVKAWAPDTKYQINIDPNADSSVIEVKSLEDGEIHGSDSEKEGEVAADKAAVQRKVNRKIIFHHHLIHSYY